MRSDRRAHGTRRPRRLVAAAACLLALVPAAGCARQEVRGTLLDATPAPAVTAGAASAPPARPTPDAAAFPVTIEHEYGSATIPGPPRRIVALDAEEDTLVALGITPLTYTPLPGGGSPAPWLGEDLDLTRSQAIDLDGGIDLDQIRALAPDLILRTRAIGGSRGEYRKLAEIAPTVYFPYGQAWQDVSRAVGRAVGLGPAAEEAVAAAESEVAAVGADRPGLAGHTFAAAYVFDADGLAPLDAEDPAARVLRALGLRIAPGLADLGPATGRTELDWADTPRLDADLLLLAYASDDLESEFTGRTAFRRLRASADGGYARLDAVAFGQLRNPTLRSLPWALHQIEPALDAVAGAG